MLRRIATLAAAALLGAALLAGCSSPDGELVSKTPFPEFSAVDTDGESIGSDVFGDWDATIINFWNNGCGTCIAEMPELEEMYQQFKTENVNLIGVAADSGESDEQLACARDILHEKGVTYANISPSPESSFYQDFVKGLTGYPTTYIVDREGNIIGAPIIGNVKAQEQTVRERIERARS